MASMCVKLFIFIIIFNFIDSVGKFWKRTLSALGAIDMEKNNTIKLRKWNCAVALTLKFAAGQLDSGLMPFSCP